MKSTIQVFADGETSSILTVPKAWGEPLFVFLKEHHLGTTKSDAESGDDTIHVAVTPAELHPLIQYFLKRSQIHASEIPDSSSAQASITWQLKE